MDNLYYLIGIVIVMIFCLKKKEVSNYVNYDKLHENPILNCPEQYEIGMGVLGKRFQTIQPFGYTNHPTFDMTRFSTSDIPLPVDPDFFM